MPAVKLKFNKFRQNNLILLGLMLLMPTMFIGCDEFIDSDYRFEETFSKTISLQEAGSFHSKTLMAQ